MMEKIFKLKENKTNREILVIEARNCSLSTSQSDSIRLHRYN